MRRRAVRFRNGDCTRRYDSRGETNFFFFVIHFNTLKTTNNFTNLPWTCQINVFHFLRTEVIIQYKSKMVFTPQHYVCSFLNCSLTKDRINFSLLSIFFHRIQFQKTDLISQLYDILQGKTCSVLPKHQLF